ncbi:MAG: type II secretion system F family protein [Dehalococcoidia bacterium]|nr:type II secretion system F family protein [Dehalococcoidia bacterium]
MPLILSLTFAVGLLLVFLSATTRWAPVREEQPLRSALRAFLDRNGAGHVGVRDFVLISTAGGTLLGLATQLALGWPMVGATAFLLGLTLPSWYLTNRHQRERTTMQAALAEAVDSLRSAVRAGMSVEEALASLARNGPEVLRPPLTELARDLRVSGFEEAVRRSRERLADPVFDMVAAALLMSHRVGGRNLSTVLEALSRSVRQTIQVEQELRAHQAKNVLSARIIAALPLALILVIRGLNPDYLDVFSSAEGQGILAVCLLSVAVGYAGMLRATRLPGEERVLL